jgi:thymidylate synthase (FAD)
MKIINPSVEIMRSGLETEMILPEKHIEKVGCTCYKSEDKITETSAAKFVSGLVKRGHEAMIEHFNLIFRVDSFTYEEFIEDWKMLMHNGNLVINNCNVEGIDCLRPFLRFTDTMLEDGEVRFIVSGNMRALRDYAKACVKFFGFIPQYFHGVVRNYPIFFPEFQDYVPVIIQNDKLHHISVRELLPNERRIHQNITVKIVCDRGVSHEIVRHRVASFAHESTRYCNYGLDKFGGEITVVRPSWCSEGDHVYDIWMGGCKETEESYFAMLNAGATPQEARAVLPNSLKTEIIVTMNPDGWDHFFHLRCAPDAQPDMREIAIMTKELFAGNMLY